MDVPENGNASTIGDFDTGNDDKPVGLRVFHNFKTNSAYSLYVILYHMFGYYRVVSPSYFH